MGRRYRPSSPASVGDVGYVARGKAKRSLEQYRHRVPEDLPEPKKQLADEAMEAIVAVARGKVRRGAQSVLKASEIIRNELCGPIPTSAKLDLGGPVTLSVQINTGASKALEAPPTVEVLPEPEKP